MQPRVGVLGRAVQPGHDAAYRTDQVAVPGEGLLRGHRTHAAAVADALRARPQPHRSRCPVGAVQRRIAAGEALRPAHDRMVRAFESIHVHREGMSVERRRFSHHQPLGDLHRRQAVHRIEDHRCGRRRAEGGGIAGEVAQEVVDLVVGAQAPGKAGPARPSLFLLRGGPEDRTEQGLYAIRSNQHPGRARCEMALVEVGMSRVEVVVGDDHRQRRRCLRHHHADRLQPPGQAPVVAAERHRCRPQAFLGPPGSGAQRGPECGRSRFHGVVARDDVSPERQGSELRLDGGFGMRARQGGDDLLARAVSVEQR